MQIKADSKIADVQLHNLKLENVAVTDLSQSQSKCVQSLKELKEGDKVLVIFTSEVKKGKIHAMDIPLDEPYIILFNGSTVEDFVDRLKTLITEEPQKTEEHAEK